MATIGPQFQPVIVNDKADLDTLAITNGQYIVILNTNEIYIDKDGERVKVSGANVSVGAEEPSSPAEGDIWIVTAD